MQTKLGLESSPAEKCFSNVLLMNRGKRVGLLPGSPHAGRRRSPFLLAVGLLSGLCAPLSPAALERIATPAVQTAPEIPLPPARPAGPQSELGALAPKADVDCLAAMEAMGLEAEAAIIDASRKECGIDTPVRISRLRTKGAVPRSIEFPDKPILACRFGLRFGQWVRDLAAPLIAGRLGADLRAVHTGPGFDCRHVNHNPKAKISPHGSGLAVDVSGFELANGQHLAVIEIADEAKVQLLATLRTGACGWFTTILGPGTDPDHATHWHFDILRHGSSDNYRICQ